MLTVIHMSTNRIGYKDHDGYIYNVNHGYQTMFAYFKQYEEKTITASDLNNNIFFLGDCDDFSYAAVPKLYASVLGATGTLKDLSEGERNILRRRSIAYYDDDPNIHGGTHVVQALTSSEVSVETQIKRHTIIDKMQKQAFYTIRYLCFERAEYFLVFCLIIIMNRKLIYDSIKFYFLTMFT